MNKKTWIELIGILLLLPSLSLAGSEDHTLFGRAEDAYGPKPGAWTFTMGSGLYLHGRDQFLRSREDKMTEVWNYAIRIGYDISKFLELEAGLGFSPTQSVSGTLNVYNYAFNGVFQWPVTERFVPYAAVGIGAATFRGTAINTNTRFAVEYGAGLKFFVFKNLALRPDVRALTSFDRTHTAFLGTLNLTYYAGPKKAAPVPTPVPAMALPPTPTPVPTPSPTPEPTATPAPTPDYKEISGSIEGVHFSSNSAVLNQDSFNRLNHAAEILKKYPALRIQIEGHTDSSGKSGRNLRLSRDRAESVRLYLISQGVDGARMETVGYGATRPVGDNKTEAGKAHNRRIEFKFLNPEVLPKG